MYLPYTGIGSRQTPNDILTIMTNLAFQLSRAGYTLRSGGADGADTAFEQGADPAKMEIFLPWLGFNGRTSQYTYAKAQAFKAIEDHKFHPYWENVKKPGARKLHARNVHQVAGWELNSPSKFVVCWTPNGETVGGTATAIRVAEFLKIPVYNFGKHSLQQIADGIQAVHEAVTKEPA